MQYAQSNSSISHSSFTLGISSSSRSLSPGVNLPVLSSDDPDKLYGEISSIMSVNSDAEQLVVGVLRKLLTVLTEDRFVAAQGPNDMGADVEGLVGDYYGSPKLTITQRKTLTKKVWIEICRKIKPGDGIQKMESKHECNYYTDYGRIVLDISYDNQIINIVGQLINVASDYSPAPHRKSTIKITADMIEFGEQQYPIKKIKTAISEITRICVDRINGFVGRDVVRL
jgi:hypothetical protein